MASAPRNRNDRDAPERERRVEVYRALRARDRHRSIFSWPDSPAPRPRGPSLYLDPALRVVLDRRVDRRAS